MSRSRLLMLGLLGLLTVGAAYWAMVAIADPTILETEACEVKNEEVAVLCVVPTGQKTLWAQNQAGEWSFNTEIQKSTTALLAGLTSEAVPAVNCSVASGSLLIDTTATATLSLKILKAQISLKSCLVTNSKETEEACTVTEPIEIHGEGAIEAITNVGLEQEGTKQLAEIVVKSKEGKTCSVAKTALLTGSQRCYFSSETLLTGDAKENLLTCPGEGSQLLLGEQEAEFSLEENVSLGKGNEWGLKGGPVELTNGDPNFGDVKKLLTRNVVYTFTNRVAIEYTGINFKRLLGATNGYKEVAKTCTGAKAVNATCTVEVQFAPQNVENYVSVLELFYEVSGAHITKSVGLVGRGTA